MTMTFNFESPDKNNNFVCAECGRVSNGKTEGRAKIDNIWSILCTKCAVEFRQRIVNYANKKTEKETGYYF